MSKRQKTTSRKQQATVASSSTFPRVASPPTGTHPVIINNIHSAAELNQKGVAYLVNGDFDTSLDHFKKALFVLDYTANICDIPSTRKKRKMNEPRIIHPIGTCFSTEDIQDTKSSRSNMISKMDPPASACTTTVSSNNNSVAGLQPTTEAAAATTTPSHSVLPTISASIKPQRQVQNNDINRNNVTLSFDGSFVNIPHIFSDEHWFHLFNKAVTLAPNAKNDSLTHIPIYRTIVLFNIALCYHVMALSLLAASSSSTSTTTAASTKCKSSVRRIGTRCHSLRTFEIQHMIRNVALMYNKCSNFLKLHKFHTSPTLMILAGAINNEAQIYYEDLIATVDDDEFGTKSNRRYCHRKNLIEQLCMLVQKEIFRSNKLGSDKKKVKGNFLSNIHISRNVSNTARTA